MSASIDLVLVGLGKIAHDQHLPAIANHPDFRLAATVDPIGEPIDGVPHFADLASALDSVTGIAAAVLCTPPGPRARIAQCALARGLHVMLEKPPAATVAEAAQLRDLAEQHERTLFAAWHSRYAGGVAPLRTWLHGKRIERIEISWREDARVWHPGQDWIWAGDGFGVFDPGINALSILTAILAEPVSLRRAEIEPSPADPAPVRAKLELTAGNGVPVAMALDFAWPGTPDWTISLATDVGPAQLSAGGGRLQLPMATEQAFADREYHELYNRFAALIGDGMSDCDLAPLALVEEALSSGGCTARSSATEVLEP